MFPDINISDWAGLLWEDEIQHCAGHQTIFVISGLTAWHHLDITLTSPAQSWDKTDQLLPRASPSSPCFITNISLSLIYNQTEDCNYPYFVFLLNLWSRKFLICLKQDQIKHQRKDEFILGAGRSHLFPAKGKCYCCTQLLRVFQVGIKQLRTLSILSVGVYKEVQTDRNIFVFIFTLLWRCNFFRTPANFGVNWICSVGWAVSPLLGYNLYLIYCTVILL